MRPYRTPASRRLRPPRRVKRVKIYRSKDRRPGGSRDLAQALRQQPRAATPREDATKPASSAPPP